MATRATKTGSAGVEFSTAPQPWQIADLDADLDAIFTNIDNSNIKTGANIATAKLATDAGIVTGMLAPLAVTTAKIAVGASTPTRGFGTPIAATIGISAETDVAVCGSITTRGGSVLVLGSIAMIWAGVTAAAATGNLTLRIRRGATEILRVVYTSLHVSAVEMLVIPCPQIIDPAPTAGSYVYKLTAQLATDGTLSIGSTGVGDGLVAQELA